MSSFYSQGVEIELIFRSTGSGFCDTGTLSKLAYLGMKHGHWPKFQKLHVYSLSAQGGWNLDYFHPNGSNSKILVYFQSCHIWAWNWSLTKLPEVAYKLSFHQRGSKLSLFSLYEQQFPRYRPIFKIAIFAIWVWNLAIRQSSRSCTYTLFLPLSKSSLFLLYEQLFPSNRPIYKIAIFGYETWSLAKVPEVAHILSKLLPISP